MVDLRLPGAAPCGACVWTCWGTARKACREVLESREDPAPARGRRARGTAEARNRRAPGGVRGVPSPPGGSAALPRLDRFHSRPPSRGAESAQLRRGVWREIESRGLGAGGAVPRYHRFAVSSAAALLVAALVGLAVLSRERPGPAASPAAAAVPAAPEETVVAVAPPRTVEESAAPEPVPAKARPLRARAGRHTGAAPPEVVKIEFQTANPDDRIIWLVKKGAETPSAAGRNQEVS